jgi:hypothetical protein
MPAPESRDTTASSPDEADVPEHKQTHFFTETVEQIKN